MNSSCKNGEDRNNVSKDEFNELIEFFEPRDQLARPFLTSLKEIFKSLARQSPVGKEAFDQARSRLESYRSSFLLSEHFVGVEADYEIYRISNKLHAVHRYFRGALLERMRYLDDTEQAPVILTGSTRDELAKKISQVGLGLNWDMVPATLMRFCSQPITHGAKASVEPVLTAVSRNAPPVPVDRLKTLQNLQHELRAIYKSKNPYALRMSAWGMVVSLKVARRLSSKLKNV
jgi:hypothetical protein